MSGSDPSVSGRALGHRGGAGVMREIERRRNPAAEALRNLTVDTVRMAGGKTA